MSKHTLLVATELSTEDLLELFISLAEKLTHQRNRAIKEAEAWKREFEMWRNAWLREMGGTIIYKSHEIDGFVLRTREIYQQAQQWCAYKEKQNNLKRDSFWDVPEPK